MFMFVDTMLFHGLCAFQCATARMFCFVVFFYSALTLNGSQMEFSDDGKAHRKI